MRNNRILKSIIAIVFVFGLILSNLSSVFVKAAESTKVVVHKLELSSVEDWPKKPGPDGSIEGNNSIKYDGSQIANITQYFGEGTKELDGVEFFYWKLTKDQYDYMMKTPDNYKTVSQVESFFDKVGGDTAFNAKDGAGATAKNSKLSKTTAGGQGFEVTLEDGYYWFVENFGSKLTGDNAGKTLSKAAAVPFGLALPVYKTATGDRFTENDPLHIYPKNTLADKPKTDKNFADGDIQLDNNKRDKGSKDVFAGQVVPYQVVTEIPAGADYKTANWNDQMTEGLTYTTGSLVLKVAEEVLNKDEHYTLEETDRGFTLKLTEDGLEKINQKDAAVKVKLTYTATVNDKAIVDIPEANDVTFHYGNNPSHGNTPKPNKPNPDNGQIKVKKTWAEGEFPQGVTATMKLINAQTGVEVGTVNLTREKQEHIWENLDKDTEYKVVEVWNGYTPEYILTKNEAGTTEVKNHKDDNPEPQDPSEPKVVTGGKRFQKVDASTKAGLAGAEFYVTKTEQDVVKYLAKKSEQQIDLEQAAYVAAEKAYKDAVKASQPSEDLKVKRDNAYKVVNTQWKWIEEGEKANAFVVTSGEDGYFKVTGLAYGDYSLVEKTAPTGYAKLKDPVPFNVKQNSNEVTNLNTNMLSDEGLKLVENKKVTIPETGGIGTVIFTVVGALVMASSVIAMRRRKSEE